MEEISLFDDRPFGHTFRDSASQQQQLNNSLMGSRRSSQAPNSTTILSSDSSCISADLIDLDLDGKSIIRQFDPLSPNENVPQSAAVFHQRSATTDSTGLPSSLTRSSLHRSSVASSTPTTVAPAAGSGESFIRLSSCRSSIDSAVGSGGHRDLALAAASNAQDSNGLSHQRLKISLVKSENDDVKSFRSMVLRIHREMTSGPFPEFMGGDEELPAPLGHCGLVAARMAPEHVKFSFTDSIQVSVHKTDHVPCGHAPTSSPARSSGGGHAQQQLATCVNFECSVTSSPEMIVTQALFDFCGDEVASKFNAKEFVLRIRDTMECLYSPLVPTELLSLASFEKTWLCLRANKKLEYYLESKADLGKDLVRTREDVGRPFVADDLAKRLNEPSMQDAGILVDAFENEMSKLMDMFPSREQIARRSATTTSKKAWSILGADERQKLIARQVLSVYQAVRAICTKHRHIEPNRVTDAMEQLMSCTTLSAHAAAAPLDSEEAHQKRDVVFFALRELRHAIARLLRLFTTTFRSPFSIIEPAYQHHLSCSYQQQAVDAVNLLQIETIRLVNESPRIEIECIHNLPPEYSMEYGSSYILVVGLQYGCETLAPAIQIESKEGGDSNTPNRISFNESFNFEGITIAQLPREAKFTICLFGLKPETIPAQQQQHSSHHHHHVPAARTTVFYQCQRLLGWASICLFDVNGVMRQGDVLVCLHRNCEFRGEGPEVSCSNDPDAAIALVHLPEYAGQEVIFPKVLSTTISSGFTARGVSSPTMQYDFNQLDENTRQQLEDIMEKNVLCKLTQAELDLLWEKRHYLRQKWVTGEQRVVLPRILQAAPSWSWYTLRDIYALLDEWGRQVDYVIEPIDALQLLCSYDYPDHEVHVFAVKCLERSMVVCGGGNGGGAVSSSDDRLENYMMQLVTALRFENYDASPLAKLLLESAMRDIPTAHVLFWTLKQYVNDKLMGRRYRMMLNALLTLCGRGMRANFNSQENLTRSLAYVAEQVKRIKDPNQRMDRLKSSLALTNELFKRSAATTQQQNTQNTQAAGPSTINRGIILPLDVCQRVIKVDVTKSYYYNSTSTPLKLCFTNYDSSDVNVIFKVGDDLRQDQLAIQIIRAMDRIWKDDVQHPLDLHMRTFSVLPTDFKKGLIEMVEDAETLRKIQTVDMGHGVTGSFKDTPLAAWLRRYNPLDADYARAVERFSRSCAGYCVATYILGICDRHNDNIMVQHDGRMFHIDFGKYMGDSQMALGGTIRRDRVPFVLTPDMAYVINDGDRPSPKFHEFVDLCCTAFNIIRQRSNQLLVLFSAMSESDIPGVTGDYAVRYIQKALMPDASDAQATAHFTRMIEESLKSWFTRFNFVMHNLAQLRFMGDSSAGAAPGGTFFADAAGGGDAGAGGGAAPPIGSLNQPFSFCRDIIRADTQPRITNIDCFGYQKRYDPDKLYVFVMRVYRVGIKAIEPDFVFRTYKELQELSNKLALAFPQAAVKLHPLTKGVRMGRTNVKQVADRRKCEVDMFLSSLMQQTDAVAHNDVVYTFFHRLPRDVRFERATDTVPANTFSPSTPPTPLGGGNSQQHQQPMNWTQARFNADNNFAGGSLSGDSGSELGGGPPARDSVDFCTSSSVINRTSSIRGGRPLSLDAEKFGNIDFSTSKTTANAGCSSVLNRAGSSLALVSGGAAADYVAGNNNFDPLGGMRSRRSDSDASTLNSNSFINNIGSVSGEIKLSVDYRDDSLYIMLNHCKDLTLPNGEPPDSYVKCYLVPDPMRTTKRKTKVVRKSHHPTFNEQLVYHLPLQTIRYCILSITVLHYDRFKENQVLGAVSIPLESIFSASNKSSNNAASSAARSSNNAIRRAQSQSEFAERRRSSASGAGATMLGEAKWYPLKPLA